MATAIKTPIKREVVQSQMSFSSGMSILALSIFHRIYKTFQGSQCCQLLIFQTTKFFLKVMVQFYLFFSMILNGSFGQLLIVGFNLFDGIKSEDITAIICVS